MTQRLRRIENRAAGLIFLALAILPAAEILSRLLFRSGLRGTEAYIRSGMVWGAFLAGAIATREGSHLTLRTVPEPRGTLPGRLLAGCVRIFCAGISLGLALSALSFVLIGFDPRETAGGLPIRLVAGAIPAGFALTALRFLFPSQGKKPAAGSVAGALLLGLFLGIPAFGNLAYTFSPAPAPFWDLLTGVYYDFFSRAALPLTAALLLSAAGGTPIFILLGGTAYFLFSRSWGAPEVLPNEAYRLLTEPGIPAIPLFTLAGFFLSESRAGERLIRVFRCFAGGLPGGMALIAVLVSAFFTTFTGASGVTILALGPLLIYLLTRTGEFEEGFSQGLVTASGSIGLLFPPSLPVIMYAVTARVSVKDMFLGGLLPGLLLTGALAAMGAVKGFASPRRREFRFDPREAGRAFAEAAGELLLPLLILGGFFGGIFTLAEAGAVALIYVILLEGAVHRDFSRDSFFRVMDRSLPIIGGVLMILAASKGLSFYLVDAEAPQRLTSFVGEHIPSPLAFLMLLNLILLLTGCLMDIFSAILVVAPLIVPMGELFQIHPVRLGVIFLANLQLGSLTPPVGMNLFLASYRFETPLGTIYKRAAPFLLVLLATVLLITYVPWFSLALL